ncbi:MAG: SpoIIE family protein phosphatase [Oscillospiraceae bacterium]
MSTKEEIKAKARRARETGQVILHWPSLVRTAEYLIRMLLGGMLAGAEIFGGYAPFGLGMVAASGAGLEGFSALVGACFGYLAFRGFVDALPYVAACILTFSVSFAFYDVKLYRQGWFMPVVAALLDGVTGFVYLSDTLTGVSQAVFFATELLLVAASAYFYRLALSPWARKREDTELTTRQMVSLFILGCTLLIALAEVRLPGGISLGCLAGALCTMLAAWKGGAGFGAAAGVCTGLAMDLAVGQAPQYAMAYAFAGLLTGVFWKQGKLFAALTYVLANGVMVLWRWESGPSLGILYEVFAASVIFMVLPDSLTRRVAALLSRERSAAAGAQERSRTYTKERLIYTADAFRELYDGLRTSFRRVAPNDADGSGIFHRAANKVCVLCALRDHCWQREYPATMNALNDGLPAMMKRGRGEAEDFPLHFRTRCLNFPLLLATANEELTALRYRRQFQSRARESREAVCRQYALFARSLDEAARQLEEEPVRDPGREKRVGQRLAALSVEGDGSVWYDPAGHLILEVSGPELDALKKDEEKQRLSRLVGVPLGEPEKQRENGVTRLRWRQAEPLMAVAGVAARKKDGQTVSGDAGAWFKTEEGGLFVLLCDGMGSGPDAHRESTLAIRLLEKFLRTGMEPEEALNTLNSALALRCEEEGGFTTIDLFRLDLYTGEAGFYKLGAAPTYVRRKGAVTRVTGSALPAGLAAAEGGPDVSKMRLEAGDSVVLISDGVASAEEDGWVKEALAAYDGSDPKALAAALMEGSAKRQGATDDRTAVVLTVKERS